MSTTIQVDEKNSAIARAAVETARPGRADMTPFVESCVETAAGAAVEAARKARHRPRARRLLRLLADKKNILITTHQHPDPDALGSSFALLHLLKMHLKDAHIRVSIKGPIGGGYNKAFIAESDVEIAPWDEQALREYDAIVLLDVQPAFKLSPLPQDVLPVAVIDHHRSRGRRPRFPFSDIRTDVGATSSIIFSYYMELEADISADLAAMLLFAIETDLAGAAGTPGDLDNVAMSSLTLLADTRKLYNMRYADLPQNIYISFASGLANAVVYDEAMITHLDMMESPEAPAVVADFLLRFDKVKWVLGTAVAGRNLVMSLRSGDGRKSAADIMRRLVRGIGEGGGHKTKAGGLVPLESGSAAQIERVRQTLRRRLLRAIKIRMSRGQRLVPPRLA
jgi:nanoRNase/pAp phosphatase (c-di-AMP/oligoRNAs hydrolase)